MNTKVLIAIFVLAAGHLALSYQPQTSQSAGQYIRWLNSELTRVGGEARQWKDMAEDMVRDVECIPLVGGKENRRFNRQDDPSTVVNDPERFWYS